MLRERDVVSLSPQERGQMRYSTRTDVSRAGFGFWANTLYLDGDTPTHDQFACPSTLFAWSPTPTFQAFLVSLAQAAYLKCKYDAGKGIQGKFVHSPHSGIDGLVKTRPDGSTRLDGGEGRGWGRQLLCAWTGG